MVQKELEKCVKLYSNALKIKQYNNSIFEKKSGDYFPNYNDIIKIAETATIVASIATLVKPPLLKPISATRIEPLNFLTRTFSFLVLRFAKQ